MEIKRNEATINRPKGDRVIDAPFVFLDIPEFIRQVKKEKAWKKNDRNGITIFKSDGITMVLTILQEGAKIRDKRMDEFLILQVLNGKANISTEEGEFEMRKKNAATFHPGLAYSIEAMTKTTILLITFNDNKINF